MADVTVTGDQARATLLTYRVTSDTPLGLVPLRVCSTWRCGDRVTDVSLDYMYNNQGMSRMDEAHDAYTRVHRATSSAQLSRGH